MAVPSSYTPQAGDYVYIKQKNWQHSAIIKSVQEDSITVISGNHKRQEDLKFLLSAVTPTITGDPSSLLKKNK